MATVTLRLLAAMLFGFSLTACGSDGEDVVGTTSTVAAEADDTTTTTTSEEVSETSTTTTSEPAGETSTTSVSATSTTTTEPPDQSSLVVTGTGLVVTDPDTGDPITLDFGADRSVVISTVSSGLGAIPVESEGSVECPNAQATVATWPDLILDFDADDGFLSWRLPVGSQLTDGDGLGLGSTRSDLSETLLASIEETSLGTEFGMKDSVAGLLSGPEEAATVDVLWAGDICAFR